MKLARPFVFAAALLILMSLPARVLAQEDGEDSSDFGFGMDLGLGTTVIEDPLTGEAESWQSLSLRPDLSFGKFGIGLAIDLNFAFSDDEGNPGFRVREEDWVPSEQYSFLELYLPIFRYVRYGMKGDPLFAKIGSIDDFLLGNGFIIANYSNTLFLPEQRISGLSFDLDGNLFDFPYIGLETVVGNLSQWDILGARLYTRPIYWSGVPIIKELQLGFTFIGDRKPLYFERKNPDTSNFAGFFDEEQSVFIWGTDLRLPILSKDAISLAAFSDLVFQNESTGGMIGFGGKLVNLITYGAQIRFLGQNFIPTYFDSSYDLYRGEKWFIYNSDTEIIPAYTGWFTTLGIEALESQIVFNANLEGSFGNPDNNEQLRPTLTGVLSLSDELLGGFSVDARYQKKYISDFADLISPENAVIGATIGYNTGPATISMIYDLKYDPTVDEGEDNWKVTTKLETSISLFN